MRISKRHIEYKIHQYRAIGIREVYYQRGEIEPIWLQNLGTKEVTKKVTKVTRVMAGTLSDKIEIDEVVTKASSTVTFEKINSADDINISECDCTIGRKEIPEIVSLPGRRGSMHDKGLYRVSTASRQQAYYPTTINRFYGFIKGTPRAEMNYYWKIGNILYIHPYRKQMNVILILDNPLDSGITERDEYPISQTLAEFIVMKILTQDFNIEAKMAGDLRNDAADVLLAAQQKLT